MGTMESISCIRLRTFTFACATDKRLHARTRASHSPTLSNHEAVHDAMGFEHLFLNIYIFNSTIRNVIFFQSLGAVKKFQNSSSNFSIFTIRINKIQICRIYIYVSGEDKRKK